MLNQDQEEEWATLRRELSLLRTKQGRYFGLRNDDQRERRTVTTLDDHESAHDQEGGTHEISHHLR